jgi:hypothetical protein
MSSIEFTFLLAIFALPAALIFLVVYMIVVDIRITKERKAFHAAVEQCKEACGAEFTSKVLGKCVEGRLPYKSMIDVLNYHTKESCLK